MNKIKKYDWLNNPPDWIVENLKARVEMMKKPGDDELFEKLRDKLKIPSTNERQKI